MAQQATAMSYFAGRLVRSERLGAAESANHLIGGDAQSDRILPRPLLARGNHNMPGQQVRPASLAERDVNNRNNRAAQIKDSHQERRRPRNPRHRRPLDHLFHLQHRKAKALSASAEDAILTLHKASLLTGL